MPSEIFNIFGSENSTDLDVLVFLNELPSLEVCKKLCENFDELIESRYEYNKKVNSNLAIVKDGIITMVFKGSDGEVNNSLFTTYNYHAQIHPIQINRVIPWSEELTKLKVSRFLRIVLTFLSRTQYRNMVKSALKTGRPSERLLVLDSILLETISDFKKNNLDNIEIYKTIAFQIGQTLGYMMGQELYTKDAIGKRFPQLDPYLKREQCEVYDLDKMLNILVCKIQTKYDVDNEL